MNLITLGSLKSKIKKDAQPGGIEQPANIIHEIEQLQGLSTKALSCLQGWWMGIVGIIFGIEILLFYSATAIFLTKMLFYSAAFSVTFFSCPN